MKNYIDLLNNILSFGEIKSNRTGTNTRTLIGQTLTFNDINCQFPLITTKRIPFRIIFEEIMFFLRGETQTKRLEEKGIKIWKGNTSREFLDKRGLFHLDEGNMGKGYGHQLRNFGTSGYDQLKALIYNLKTDPSDRRHVVTHWCPYELNDAALPPCHIVHMYSVSPPITTNSGTTDRYLDSSFIMRSSDAFHGLPFNIASYALMNILVANCCGYIPRSLVYFGHDVHLYESHLDVVQEQITRKPQPLPKLVLGKQLHHQSLDETMKELLTLEFTDITLENYTPLGTLRAPMVI